MSASTSSVITGMGLERVVAQMPAAVVVVEAPSGRIVHVNARAREMTERQLGRSVPPDLTPDWEIFHPDGRPYTMDEWPLVRSITTREEVVDEEYFNVLADGSRMMVRCSASPILDDEGRVVAGVLVMTEVTEEKRRQEHLTYLAGLLDNTEDAIVALDAGWVLTVWNKGAERLYGWTADEVVGRHTLEVARLEMSDRRRAAVRRTVADQGRWRGEVVAYRKDGTPVCVELIVVALHAEGGEITGYLGIHRDATERKRIVQALVEARRRSETILERITDAFAAVDREWRLAYVNEHGLDRLRRRGGEELTREDILGTSIWELVPELVGTEIEHKCHEAMRDGHPIELETYLAPDWMELRLYPSESGLSIYFRNVSDRRRAEEEMRRRAEQQALVADLGRRALGSDDLQALLDEAVGLVARTLGVELAAIGEMVRNGDEIVFRAGFGWREGVVGTRVAAPGRDSLMGYTFGADEPVIVEDMATEGRFTPSPIARDHGAVSALSVMIESPDEPFGTLSAISTSRRTFSGPEVSFVQAVANVLASAVERSRVQERIIEVREVERRRIALDLHDEALQDLTYALALASRAPADGHVAGGPNELTAALERVGEQLRGAIYDLRLGGEEQTPFAELLGGLVAVYRGMAVDCEIELELHDAPGGPLGATGVEVLRIIGEALTNARRHAGARRVAVRVWASDVTLHAEVSDDGRGFDPGGRSAPVEGHGIRGMRERAELLHGRLEISSDGTGGATVRVDVPLPTLPGGDVEQVRVLLVEDHTAVREAIAAAFARDAGFDVVGQAASLAEARDMLEGLDVAVVDLGLPDGFGADLIEELHAINPRAQALVLSASVDQAEIARAIQLGAAGVLDKMAHLDEVVDAVRRLRAGETLIAVEEVVALLRFAGRQQEQERQQREAIARLTPREREVLQALGDGLDSQRIAARLNISVRTERNHVASILTKLGVHSQLQAVLFALRYGVIKLP